MSTETKNIATSDHTTEDMTVAEAKEKFKQGELTTEAASTYEPDTHGYDCTFLCKDGYFTAFVRIGETVIEDEHPAEDTADNN